MTDSGLTACLPMRMLVVDDDDLMAEMVAEHFRTVGFEVAVVRDGQQALEAMEAALPDVVLCDRRMPVLSGAGLLETVRGRDAAWQRVTFVFMTGLSDHRDRMAMLRLSPDGYICKPIDFPRAERELVVAIAHARERSAALQS